MAIPGYTEPESYSSGNPEYYTYTAGLIGILGDTHSEVLSTLNDVREEIMTYANFSILDSNGYVYLEKLNKPNINAIRALGINVFLEDTIEFPIVSGFVSGTLCIFFGTSAANYIKGWASNEYYINNTPNLLVERGSVNENVVYPWDGDPEDRLKVPPREHQNLPIQTILFVATYMTRFGESGPSNIVAYYTDQDEWQTTLSVEDDSIPEYVLSVRYYRFFDVFRLIGEVPYNGV